MANEVSKVAAEVKKAAVGSEAKKQQLYSRDALMPENVFDLLPYKETHEALKESDEDKLRELLCGFVVSIAKGVWEQSWDAINDKKEKKGFNLSGEFPSILKMMKCHCPIATAKLKIPLNPLSYF